MKTVQFKVICHADNCDFVCFHGTKEECQSYVEATQETSKPLEIVPDMEQLEFNFGDD